MREPIPANGPMYLYVGTDPNQIEHGHPLPWAMICPDYDNWNDYGYGLFANIWIMPTNGIRFEIRFRIMFSGFRRSAAALDQILASKGSPITIDQVRIPFVSLFPEITDYRTIISELGFDSGIIMLRMLHDANVVRLEGINEEALNLIRQEAFHVGVLRYPGAYEAFTRGGKYLRHQSPPEPVDTSGTYSFSAKLPNADMPHELELEFTPDSIFRDRACVLIGRNGAGKTQMLKAVVDALSGNSTVHAKFEPSLKVSRVLVFSSVSTDPFDRVIPAWRGIDYEYFAVNSSVADRPTSLIGSLLACWRERPSTLPDGTYWSRHSALADMLRILGMETGLYLPLRQPEGAEELPYVTSVGDRLYFPYWRELNEQGQLRLSHRLDWDAWPIVLAHDFQPRTLSSGEHALLRLSAQMAASIEAGSLLLFDEPETHLHPNFVSELMSLIYSLLDRTKSAAIIATHSAYVVREVGRTKVNVVSLVHGKPDSSRPIMQTFGASIDSISQFVFGDSGLEHRFQRTLDTWLSTNAQGLAIEEIIDRYGSHLNSEALSLIARMLKTRTNGA